MKTSIPLLAVAAPAITLISCKKNNPEPENTETPIISTTQPSALTKIGEGYITGASAKAVVYSPKNFETGYNEIYVAVFDSVDNSAITDGHFSIDPMMDMGNMQHSSPVENSENPAVDGYFKSAVVFSMAGNVGQWWLNMSFHNHKNNRSGLGKLAVDVKSPSPARFKSTVLPADNNTIAYITLVTPIKPVVGVNDFEIILHKKVNAMTYSAIDNYSVKIEPEMPSMGHGSPNNVDPTLTANGHYRGKVNFTMSGLWRINLKLFKNDSLLSDSQYFETTIE